MLLHFWPWEPVGHDGSVMFSIVHFCVQTLPSCMNAAQTWLVQSVAVSLGVLHVEPKPPEPEPDPEPEPEPAASGVGESSPPQAYENAIASAAQNITVWNRIRRS